MCLCIHHALRSSISVPFVQQWMQGEKAFCRFNLVSRAVAAIGVMQVLHVHVIQLITYLCKVLCCFIHITLLHICVQCLSNAGSPNTLDHAEIRVYRKRKTYRLAWGWEIAGCVSSGTVDCLFWLICHSLTIWLYIWVQLWCLLHLFIYFWLCFEMYVEHYFPL